MIDKVPLELVYYLLDYLEDQDKLLISYINKDFYNIFHKKMIDKISNIIMQRSNISLYFLKYMFNCFRDTFMFNKQYIEHFYIFYSNYLECQQRTSDVTQAHYNYIARKFDCNADELEFEHVFCTVCNTYYKLSHNKETDFEFPICLKCMFLHRKFKNYNIDNKSFQELREENLVVRWKEQMKFCFTSKSNISKEFMLNYRDISSLKCYKFSTNYFYYLKIELENIQKQKYGKIGAERIKRQKIQDKRITNKLNKQMIIENETIARLNIFSTEEQRHDFIVNYIANRKKFFVLGHIFEIDNIYDYIKFNKGYLDELLDSINNLTNEQFQSNRISNILHDLST